MPTVDPLGYSALFSQTQEIVKKKEQKTSKSTTKSKLFSSVFDAAQISPDFDFMTEVEFEKSIENKTFDEKLEFLIDSVYTAGDRLKKKQDLEEFKQYRKTLTHFLEFVVKNSYEVETQRRLRGRKAYTVVQVINEKLDSLAADIIMNQRAQLRILAKVEEINGLLVDYFS